MSQLTLKKVYHDLKMTREDLEELKSSIKNTLKEIKQIDQKIKDSKEYKNIKICVNPAFNPAIPQEENGQNIGLKQSFLFIDQQIIQYENKCPQCKQLYAETKQLHFEHFCSQTKIFCEFCTSQIPRKLINLHFKACSQKKCYKCNENIYVKAYEYHLKHCKNKNKLITPCKMLPKYKQAESEKQNNLISVIPCCMKLMR